MVSFATTVHMNQSLIESKLSNLEELCSKSKDHSVKNHKPFNKIKLNARTLTVTKLSSSQQEKVTTAMLGLVKVPVKMKPISARVSDLFLAQVMHSTHSKKAKKLMISGRHSVERPNTVQSRIWALLLVLNQDSSNARTVQDISI